MRDAGPQSKAVRPGGPSRPEPQPLRDRHAGGRALAERLASWADAPDVIVLALARGGVAVGYELARRLGLPLEVFVVRRLAIQGHEETTIGAVASGGVRIVDLDLVARLGIDARAIASAAGEQQRELERLERRYRDGRPTPALAGRDVILVDDGIATGSSMRAAVRSVRPQAPASITVAAPVVPVPTRDALEADADDVIAAIEPPRVRPVADSYDDYPEVTDREVRELLQTAIRERRRSY